uniref:Uncharacterized protein LOC100183251 n=1 Tax=Phallusia mammillata TaxID=59560 RepID=A0A6F9DH90_9ASCI|nr:uncharacterized protein LOC100183251 [Phallusia mammillata]
MQRYYESKEITDFYAKYRGLYPKDTANHVIKHVVNNKRNYDESKKLERMLEVGCGSGQATNLFAPYFKEVIATDVSPNMIKRANQQNEFSHVRYAEGCAESIDAENGSVDMILSAECAHWFDLPKYFSEVSRVLKPDGSLALLCYYIPSIHPTGSAKEPYVEPYWKVLNELMSEATYNRDAYKELENFYPNIFLKIPSDQKVSFKMHKKITVSLAVYIAMLKTVDAFQNTKKDQLLNRFSGMLKKAWGLDENTDESQFNIDLHFEFRVIVARNLKSKI